MSERTVLEYDLVSNFDGGFGAVQKEIEPSDVTVVSLV